MSEHAPTQPGWHWWRPAPDCEWRPIHWDGHNYGVHPQALTGLFPSEHRPGEWGGLCLRLKHPPPSDGTPVERFDAAVEAIRRCVKSLDALPDDRANEQTTCLEELERHAGELLAASREWK